MFVKNMLSEVKLNEFLIYTALDDKDNKVLGVRNYEEIIIEIPVKYILFLLENSGPDNITELVKSQLVSRSI